jgi:hypothetical protein
MSTFPALNYLSDAARTIAQMKTALEDFLAATKQIPGAGVAETNLTLVSDEITPPGGAGGIFGVDTQSAAATDNLARVLQTNLPDGAMLLLHTVSSARIVTVQHNAGGTGQITLKTGGNFTLGGPTHWLMLKRTGTLWTEIARFPSADHAAEITRTTAYTVTAADRSKFIDCTANSWTLTLLAASTAGRGYELFVRNSGAGTITIDANASETIDGALTLTLLAGDKVHLICGGATWKSVMLQRSAGGFTTGDVKATFKTSADPGWVLMNDGSIGSATSGATTRANADTEALYTVLWNNVNNTWAAVSTGRGASAAADFAANKRLTLPRALGRALAVSGAGSGLTARALGEYLGSENAIVVTHTHGITDPGHGHTVPRDDSAGAGASLQLAGTNLSGAISSSTNTTGITVSNAGSSGTGANMQPATFLNVMIKL